MPFGYTGQNQPNQTVSNSGVFSITDVAELQSQGKLGGSLELIEEQTFSSSSAVEFTAIQENKYDVHFMSFVITELAGNGRIYLSNNGGTSYITSGYQEALQYGFTDGSNGEQKGTSQSYFIDVGGGGTGINKNLYLYIYNAGNSSKYTFSTHQAFSEHPNGILYGFGGNVHPTAETINAIKVAPLINTMTGTIKLYGVKQI